MARGVRSNPTLLPTFSPNLQPQSMASYDPKTRRNTILIAEIVPTVAQADSLTAAHFPADRYWCPVGALASTSAIPSWFAAGSNVSFLNWDSSEERFYARFSSAAAQGYMGGSGTPTRFIYPLGYFGMSTIYAPKNTSVVAVWIKFTGRFNTNADYTTYGVGACSTPGNFFGTATDHFIQVTRNAGSWELGSCDGSTISQSSVAGADGNFHEFWVKWTSSELTLYVDETAVLTKTTNLPTQPLAPLIYAQNNTNTCDVVDYLIEWEAG